MRTITVPTTHRPHHRLTTTAPHLHHHPTTPTIDTIPPLIVLDLIAVSMTIGNDRVRPPPGLHHEEDLRDRTSDDEWKTRRIGGGEEEGVGVGEGDM